MTLPVAGVVIVIVCALALMLWLGYRIVAMEAEEDPYDNGWDADDDQWWPDDNPQPSYEIVYPTPESEAQHRRGIEASAVALGAEFPNQRRAWTGERISQPLAAGQFKAPPQRDALNFNPEGMKTPAMLRAERAVRDAGTRARWPL